MPRTESKENRNINILSLKFFGMYLSGYCLLIIKSRLNASFKDEKIQYKTYVLSVLFLIMCILSLLNVINR